MRILVVGSGGVGSAVAPIAARRDFFEAIVMADYDLGRAERVVDRVGDARFVAAGSTPPRPTMSRPSPASIGSTHVLNAVDPRFVMPIFDGRLRGRRRLPRHGDVAVATASRPAARGDRREARRRAVRRPTAWEDAGLLALVGIGVEPGLSDVFARYAADELFDEIDEVGVRDGAEPYGRGATTSRRRSRSGRRSRSA